MFCGVISTYCTPCDARAASICVNSAPRATYNHPHRHLAVHRVHKHVELVQAPDRAADRLPERKQQANGRKRLFSA